MVSKQIDLFMSLFNYKLIFKKVPSTSCVGIVSAVCANDKQDSIPVTKKFVAESRCKNVDLET